jgi:hypothetical protein
MRHTGSKCAMLQIGQNVVLTLLSQLLQHPPPVAAGTLPVLCAARTCVLQAPQLALLLCCVLPTESVLRFYCTTRAQDYLGEQLN